jgi:hypothetical protein
MTSLLSSTHWLNIRRLFEDLLIERIYWEGLPLSPYFFAVFSANDNSSVLLF